LNTRKPSRGSRTLTDISLTAFAIVAAERTRASPASRLALSIRQESELPEVLGEQSSPSDRQVPVAQPAIGRTERGGQFDEPGRSKHRGTVATESRSESRESNCPGLSKTSFRLHRQSPRNRTPSVYVDPKQFPQPSLIPGNGDV